MERKKSQYIADAGLLQGYINILISEMKGQEMPVPTTPYIPSRDPPIRRHETEYMLIPSGPTSKLGFAPILHWVRALYLGRLHFKLKDGS